MKRVSVTFLGAFLSLSVLATPATPAEAPGGVDELVGNAEAAKIMGAAVFEVYLGTEGFQEWIPTRVVRVEDKRSYWHLAYTWDQCAENPPPDPDPNGIVVCTGGDTAYLDIIKKDGRVRAIYLGR